MKIGIDIDGVIMNSENVFRVKAELYDLLELHKQGQVNNLAWAQERYDWTGEQVKEFQDKYLLEASQEASLMAGAKEVIQLLQNQGHELIIITARGGYIEEMRHVIEDKFQEEGLTFAKYYWKTIDKLQICKQENIDIMIDDRADICEEVAKAEIKTLYFRDVNREKIEKTSYLQEVNTWGEVYRKIYNWNLEEA